jgi:hypothetical protein
MAPHHQLRRQNIDDGQQATGGADQVVGAVRRPGPEPQYPGKGQIESDLVRQRPQRAVAEKRIDDDAGLALAEVLQRGERAEQFGQAELVAKGAVFEAEDGRQRQRGDQHGIDAAQPADIVTTRLQRPLPFVGEDDETAEQEEDHHRLLTEHHQYAEGVFDLVLFGHVVQNDVDRRQRPRGVKPDLNPAAQLRCQGDRSVRCGASRPSRIGPRRGSPGRAVRSFSAIDLAQGDTSPRLTANERCGSARLASRLGPPVRLGDDGKLRA